MSSRGDRRSVFKCMAYIGDLRLLLHVFLAVRTFRLILKNNAKDS